MALTPHLRTLLGEAGVMGSMKSKTQNAPSKSSGGPTNWANAGKTRGHSASGRKVGSKFESTYGSKTKLSSLGRGR